MILVLTGTHEQPFSRLVLAASTLVDLDEVVIQAGPAAVHSSTAKVVPYFTSAELRDYLARARVVVCHAGPATIFEAQGFGHVPIVVPRSARFGEHVDDHQVRFVQRLRGLVDVVDDPSGLRDAVVAHEARCATLRPPTRDGRRNQQFCRDLEGLCVDLVQTGRPRATWRDTLVTFGRWVKGYR